MSLDPHLGIMLYDLGPTEGHGARVVTPDGPRTHIVKLPADKALQLAEIVAYVTNHSDGYDKQQGPALRLVKGGAS